MNKLAIILFIAFILTSCCYNKAKFEVENSSDNTIDSLFISNIVYSEPTGNTLYKLEKKSKIDFCIDMPEEYVDGSYSIRYKINNIWYYKQFGYYTNGSQTEKMISIQIVTTDSLVIKYE